LHVLESGGEPLLAWTEDFVTTVLNAEGEIDRSLPGWLVCHWPADGEEDALWAVVAAQQVAEGLSEPGALLLELAVVPEGHLGPDHGHVAGMLQELLTAADGLEPGVIHVGPSAQQDLGRFLELDGAQGKPLRALLGLREEPTDEELEDLSEG